MSLPRIILVSVVISLLLCCNKDQEAIPPMDGIDEVPKDTMVIDTMSIMSQDTMSQDTMSQDTMSQDTMSQDSMSQDTMTNDTTNTGGGANGIPTPEVVFVEVTSCELNFSDEEIFGCDGAKYPRPKSSPYVLPYQANDFYPLGLNNCSSSFHSAGSLDQYAYDFDMPPLTEFLAMRGGVVELVVNDQPSEGGGNGNYVVISHGDGTYAEYAHSPRNGIYVKKGQRVERGEVLGLTGNSGFAGYPHLHLLVLKGNDLTDLTGIPITFANVKPANNILVSGRTYTACEYESKE